MTIQARFKQFKSGVITASELVACFGALNIHGAITKDNGFIGYDYTNQIWVELS